MRHLPTPFVTSLALLLLGALGACAAPAGDAPADPIASEEEALFWWHQHTELVESPERYAGAPAWADDSSRVAGFELRYERRVQFPPLQGWWEKRDFELRLFTADAEGHARHFVTNWLPGRPSDLFYMRSAGYFLIEVFDAAEGRIEHLRINQDGATTVVRERRLGPEAGTGDVIPSPDGAVLADYTCEPNRAVPIEGGTLIEPQRPIPCTVRFLNALLLEPVAPPQLVTLEGDELKAARFTPDGAFLLEDATGAHRFVPGGSPRRMTAPDCDGPVTTSSRISADGRRLGLAWGRIKVTSEREGDAPFGCGG